jgi:hypothetical protein
VCQRIGKFLFIETFLCAMHRRQLSPRWLVQSLQIRRFVEVMPEPLALCLVLQLATQPPMDMHPIEPS